MLGDSLLVIVDIYPKGDPKSSPVAIPTNVQWYPLKLDNHSNEHLPELKIRAGSIILTQSPTQHVEELPEEYILFVALDEKKTATGRSYNDEGEGYSYKNGNYLLSKYEATLSDNRFLLKISEEGHYRRLGQPLKIVVMADSHKEFCHVVTQYNSEIQFNITSK